LSDGYEFEVLNNGINKR